MLSVVWLPEAQAELMEAREHYEAIRPELGERFASAVVEAAEAIASMPLRFAVVDKGRRRAGVRWFPYGLFFLVEETRVVVIACFHGKHDPRRWQQRKP
jgi:plasmid stabilization system protein ParE